MSLSRDIARRESVLSIPKMDGVLSGNGRNPSPRARTDVTFAFRVFVADGNLDRAADLLYAQVAPGVPQRLVYTTDLGTLRFAVAYDASVRHTLTAANSWGGGGYCDFAVTWRIDGWRAQIPEGASVWAIDKADPSPMWAATGAGVAVYWLNGGFALPSATTAFTLDATGTVGGTQPTLADTGPVITIQGPFGGQFGILIVNQDVLVPDSTGALVPMQLLIPTYAPSANDVIVVNCATQTFTGSGVPLRPQKIPLRDTTFQINPGIVNHCYAQCFGPSPLTGGVLTVSWWRRFA
jgi:hypothetical protein